MPEKNYDPLSDMSRIKDSLMSSFCDIEDLTRLIMPTLDDADFTKEQNWYGGTFERTVNGQPETTTLSGHCFDTPYIEGTAADHGCAVFIETYLSKSANPHIKEVGVDIMVVCHQDAIRLSAEDETYYHSIGIYGNRVDSAIQVIHSSVFSAPIMDQIKKNYSIGTMNLLEENPIEPYLPDPQYYGKVLHFNYQSFYQRKRNIRQVLN